MGKRLFQIANYGNAACAAIIVAKWLGPNDFDKYITDELGVQTWRGSQAHCNRAQLTNDAHLNSANANDVAFFDACRIAHLDFVYKGAIGAVQIFQHPAVALELKPGML